jgi:hypothetical protein
MSRVNVSGDVFAGFINGDITNVSGLTANINGVLGPLSVTIFTDSQVAAVNATPPLRLRDRIRDPFDRGDGSALTAELVSEAGGRA